MRDERSELYMYMYYKRSRSFHPYSVISFIFGKMMGDKVQALLICNNVY
jgi:hypothetical protein